MGQLRKLANFYKRPISDFYLPAPPEERPFPRDFRRFPGSAAGTGSPALRRQLRFARERQELTLCLHEDLGDPLPRFDGRVSRNSSPQQVGECIRDLPGVDTEAQSGWKDAYAALRAWRQRIEALDVLVFGSCRNRSWSLRSFGPNASPATVAQPAPPPGAPSERDCESPGNNPPTGGSNPIGRPQGRATQHHHPRSAFRPKNRRQSASSRCSREADNGTYHPCTAYYWRKPCWLF